MRLCPHDHVVSGTCADRSTDANRYPDVVNTIDLEDSMLGTHGLNVTILVAPVDMGPSSRYFGAVYFLYHILAQEYGDNDLDVDNTWLITLDTDNTYNKHGIQVRSAHRNE